MEQPEGAAAASPGRPSPRSQPDERKDRSGPRRPGQRRQPRRRGQPGQPRQSGQPRRPGQRRHARPRARSGARLTDAPYAIVLAGALGGLLWLWQSAGHVKGGMLTIAAAFLVAAAARYMLPDGQAGLLASRRRDIDVAAFAILGAGLLASALVIPSPS